MRGESRVRIPSAPSILSLGKRQRDCTGHAATHTIEAMAYLIKVLFFALFLPISVSVAHAQTITALEAEWKKCGLVDPICEQEFFLREKITIEQCKKFTNSENCIQKLAFVHKNPAFCDHTEIVRDVCYFHLATTQYLPEICKKISIESYKEGCVIQASKTAEKTKQWRWTGMVGFSILLGSILAIFWKPKYSPLIGVFLGASLGIITMLYPPNAPYFSFPLFWLTAIRMKSMMSFASSSIYVPVLFGNIIFYPLFFWCMTKSWAWRIAGICLGVVLCGMSGVYLLALMALSGN